MSDLTTRLEESSIGFAGRPDDSDPGATRDEIRERIRVGGPHAIAALRELVRVDELQRQHDEAVCVAEVEGLVRVHRAMEDLRRCSTPAELIGAVPRALCASSGFSRAMVSQVRDSLWDPVAVEIVPGCDPRGDELRAYMESAEIPLRHLLLEAELVRRRVPVLVREPASDPRTFARLVQETRTTSYVAAPIMPTGRVIGFLHADRFGTTRACDERDRDALWAFAEHFGLLYERAVLVARMEGQRKRLREALASASEAIEELCAQEISLARSGAAKAPVDGLPRPHRSSATRLLTDREREILDLLVSGATNSEIARTLVISDATVKTHVARILKKLHASNRVEAVAKYLRLSSDAFAS